MVDETIWMARRMKMINVPEIEARAPSYEPSEQAGSNSIFMLMLVQTLGVLYVPHQGHNPKYH